MPQPFLAEFPVESDPPPVTTESTRFDWGTNWPPAPSCWPRKRADTGPLTRSPRLGRWGGQEEAGNDVGDRCLGSSRLARGGRLSRL